MQGSRAGSTVCAAAIKRVNAAATSKKVQIKGQIKLEPRLNKDNSSTEAGCTSLLIPFVALGWEDPPEDHSFPVYNALI